MFSRSQFINPSSLVFIEVVLMFSCSQFINHPSLVPVEVILMIFSVVIFVICFSLLSFDVKLMLCIILLPFCRNFDVLLVF